LKKAGLYIHFPFCRRACFYCHFFKKKFSQTAADIYMEYLLQEIKLRKKPELILDSVYYGGGSPSLLTVQQLRILMATVNRNFNLTANTEITLETNPEDITKQQLEAFRNLGINRLSIGVQSFQENDLRCLKRNHCATQSILAVELARDAGFVNINLDLIIGLESQTARSMDLNFRYIEKFKPNHLSVYILEGVPRIENNNRDARLYFQARQSLLNMGYQHYEVSNFCLPGKASRHNLKYWQTQPYISLGPSAAGYLDGVDYRNSSDLKKYGSSIQVGELPLVKTKQLDPVKRKIITGLRLLKGIPVSAFKPFATAVDFLLVEGFLVRRGRNLAVPPEKILLLNEILSYFI
jgi:oxygen-independent coproporphyrinogen-3 oxidase